MQLIKPCLGDEAEGGSPCTTKNVYNRPATRNEIGDAQMSFHNGEGKSCRCSKTARLTRWMETIDHESPLALQLRGFPAGEKSNFTTHQVVILLMYV